MNFFDAQDRARRATRRLVLVYLLATLTIVAGVTALVGLVLYWGQAQYGVAPGSFLAYHAPTLTGVAVVTLLFIGGATLYKTAVLAGGGGRVARQLGGILVPSDVQEPLRQRLRNVVEEMSIASGVPVPEIYVLEHEQGINAFAAGFTPEDAAVAVTSGTLELLDRDELQGVIAHEFSHILNGDMRLNIRLMGVLFGILALGLIGRMVLRGGRYGVWRARGRSRGAPAVLVIGLGLTVLGAIGVFFARLIKAGVSRQREHLADASAVQFTRQTRGLAGALKKIGGFDAGSYLRAADPEEVSHMLFSPGAKLAGLFATHPPLTERIRALEPDFDPADYPRVDPRVRADAVDHAAAAGGAALAGTGGEPAPPAIADSVGQPDSAQIDYAGWLRDSIPPALYDAAHSHEFAYLLAIALVLDRGGDALDAQLALARERLGERRTQHVRRLYDELAATGPEYRLPLLEIAFPALRRRPLPQLEFLVDLVRRMIEADAATDLYEFCFFRVLAAALEHAARPAVASRPRRLTPALVRGAAVDLLRAVAWHGHPDLDTARAAFAAGTGRFGAWAGDVRLGADDVPDVAALGRALDTLTALTGDGRRVLIEAVGSVVLHDRRLTVVEAELLRAVCATLDCPLPPIVTAKRRAGDDREAESQKAYD